MLTLTDLFCGAGGSSTGAIAVPGIQVRIASNHWDLAVETHNTNHPDADHLCADLSAIDPRRFPRTDVAELETTRAQLERAREQIPRRVDPTPLCPYKCDCGECYGFVHDSEDCHCVKRAKMLAEAAERGRQYGERFGI